MPKGEIPTPFSQENSQQFESILSALQTLSVAVASLPGSTLQIGSLETGPGATLSVTPEKGLEIQYKPVETKLVYPSKDTELEQKAEAKQSLQKPASPPGEVTPQKETERVTLAGRLAYEPSFK